MNQQDFHNPENWRGGPSYELSMAWMPSDDARILAAMRVLTGSLGFNGPWADPMLFPVPPAMPKALDRETGYKGCGLLRLEDGSELGCLVLTLLDEHAIEGCDAEYDWLILAVMGGMQEQAFKIVYSDTF